MNIQTQSEIELKLSAFEKLGDNPTEVDIKYVSYLLKIPLQTIRQWLEERAGVDFQIDLSPAEDKECQIIGCIMKKKKLINQQTSVKEEEASQKQTKNQSMKPSIDTKQYQDIKKKKQIDKIKQSDPNKKAEKALKKQAKLAALQAQYTLFEDCKTQEKNTLDNQNSKLPLSIQTQKLVQQMDISNKIHNIVQNIDNHNHQQQQQSQLLRKEKKQNRQLIQKKKLIRLDREKHQKEMNQQQFIDQQSKGQQRQCLIIIDDEINQKNQLSTNLNKERIQSNYYSTLNQNKLHTNDKLQILQDLCYFKDKKKKKPMQQALQEIQLGQQNKQQENNIIKQYEQKQNLIQINHQKQYQQQQAYPNINQTQMQNFSVLQNEQLSKQKQQVDKKTFSTQNQNLNQQSQKQLSNLSIEPLKMSQQQQSNYLPLVCNSQPITAQPNITNSANKSSPIQTPPTQMQNQESQLQKQTQIGSELNLIQTQFNQAMQGSISQNNMDKKQLPNYLSELIQMFNKNSQALGQAVQQITAVSNQQIVLMEKLDIIYECVNTK